MNLSVGIVGLPNVGKSTLFNLLTSSVIPAENYPFCTIDPNVGIVVVKDQRIDNIAQIVLPKKTVPAAVEFYDIAGLVKGAHKGEGLGNAFLTHIRNVSVIVHVVRAFESSQILHVNGKVDPIDDLNTINTELMLKDMETVEKQADKVARELMANKLKQKFFDHISAIKDALDNGKFVSSVEISTDVEVQLYRSGLSLLTDKPVIYLINGDHTDAQADEWRAKLSLEAEAMLVFMNIKEEFELSAMSDEDRADYMSELDITNLGVDRLVAAAYSKLGLISYFTAGEQEVRAWTIVKGEKAPEAAGAIHSDFEKKFITAEVIAYKDFIDCKGWAGAKAQGKVRLEGKEYTVIDGDVMLFRHGS